MRFRFASLLSAITVLCSTASSSAEKIDYARDILPIFSNKCFQCHGPDEQARKAKLRLDIRENALAMRDGIAAVVPGDPEESEAFLRITHDDPEEVMPPKKLGKPLTSDEIALIRKWIEQGAEFSKHWAFTPPKRPAVPKDLKSDWGSHPIDKFVLARLEKEQLKPSPEADRATWLRRVTIDLTGLAPTPAELDAFLADKSPQAHAKAVDRLLQSPRYGEHMARYWLDAARYADTNGYQYDRNRDQWVWRDWVINAFNTNKPFDEFTTEQIAGDLLPNATDQTRLATGFHRNHPITIEGGVIDEEYRTEYVVDRVVTTSTVWMGLTMVCSRCHDHKYDPVSQEDFYQFFAFFNQMPERGNSGFAPKMKIASPLTEGQNKQLREKIAVAEKSYQAELAKIGTDGDLMKRWEQKLSEGVKDTWRIGVPAKMTSEGGATLKVLDDQSILAGGKNPATEAYDLVLTSKTAREIAALRLEALRHESLTQGSASRGSNGNYVLSEIEVSYKFNDKVTKVKIAHADADYEQKNYGIAQAIDGQVVRGGWAVDGNTVPANRVAVFKFANPIPKGAAVRVRLIQNFGQSHQIGRFRLAVSDRATNAAPLAIQTILSTPSNKRSQGQTAQLEDYLTKQYASPALSKASSDLAILRSALAATSKGFPETMVMTDKPGIRSTHILDRGEYDKPGKKVEANVPTFFGKLPKDAPRNRLGLAQWLTSSENPLTARVTVNRLWQQLFGIGFVKSSEDLGRQSEWPTHPELLDWLAVDFMESGWDLQRLLKQIVLSSTYRQQSHLTKESHARDPDNRLLSRGPRFRLDAEVIRDHMLSSSGLLLETVGGPSVYPYHPDGLWLELNNRPGYSRKYPHPKDAANLYRRSMYTYWKRTVPPPSMSTFDAPEREACTVYRSRTNTPLQAFVLLHDPQFVEAARFLAERMMKEGGTTLEERLSFGFRCATSRFPKPEELKVMKKLFLEKQAQFREHPAKATQLLSVGAKTRNKDLDLTMHAAYTYLAHALYNLSETITKG